MVMVPDRIAEKNRCLSLFFDLDPELGGGPAAQCLIHSEAGAGGESLRGGGAEGDRPAGVEGPAGKEEELRPSGNTRRERESGSRRRFRREQRGQGKEPRLPGKRRRAAGAEGFHPPCRWRRKKSQRQFAPVRRLIAPLLEPAPVMEEKPQVRAGGEPAAGPLR